MTFIRRFFSRFGWGGVLGDLSGQQFDVPSHLVTKPTSVDGALQISTVYACARLLAGTVSSLPLMVYREDRAGRRSVDRKSRLWMILHDQPNDQMTASDFWQAMILQWALRGNAYAQIVRNGLGDLVALWPLSSDQMTVFADKESKQVVYQYTRDGETYNLKPEDVLHIKDIGTGLVGFSKLEFMNASIGESMETQKYTTANASNFGRPSGILTVDHVLDRKKGQAEAVGRALGSFTNGAGRMIVLRGALPVVRRPARPDRSERRDDLGKWDRGNRLRLPQVHAQPAPEDDRAVDPIARRSDRRSGARDRRVQSRRFHARRLGFPLLGLCDRSSERLQNPQ